MMLKTLKKRRAARDAHAVQFHSEVVHSITSLDDEDLLDLADIFRGERRGPLGDIATAEMTRRNISL
jgi:hypothetical protein